MEIISIEVRLDKKIDIDIRLDEIIDGINDCKMSKRWNYISQILNAVRLNLDDLTDEQKEIVKIYLENKLTLF